MDIMGVDRCDLTSVLKVIYNIYIHHIYIYIGGIPGPLTVESEGL